MSYEDPLDLDQQDVDDARRRATSLLAIENEEADFLWLMRGPRGRRFVRRVLDQAGVFSTSYRHNAMAMSMAEGQKQVGYWILHMCRELCQSEYQTMMQETKNVRDRAVAGDRSET